MRAESMPTIGIAGVTIPGAADCMLQINRFANQYFHEHHHPNIILDQPDFGVIHQAQNLNQWDIVEEKLTETINRLENSGAQFAIIPANTVHKVISGIQTKTRIPVINMLEVVSEECARLYFKRVGIMGTRWTMNDHLYQDFLRKHNIIEVIPSDENQQIIQQAIFSQLIPTGVVDQKAIQQLLEVVECLKRDSCDAIVLACTELPLVLNVQNCKLPVLDTTAILAKAATEKAFALYNRMQATGIFGTLKDVSRKRGFCPGDTKISGNVVCESKLET